MYSCATALTLTRISSLTRSLIRKSNICLLPRSTGPYRITMKDMRSTSSHQQNERANPQGHIGESLQAKGVVQDAIERNLREAFNPTYLQAINESHRHNVPLSSETHFKVVVVSDRFATAKNLIERHRMVNTALKDELAGSVHALSIVAKTPSEWDKIVSQSQDGIVQIASSPNCLGGDGSLPKRK